MMLLVEKLNVIECENISSVLQSVRFSIIDSASCFAK